MPQSYRDGLPWFKEGLPVGPEEGPKIDGAVTAESLIIDANENSRTIDFSINTLYGPDGQTQWLLRVGRGVKRPAEDTTPAEFAKSDLTDVVEALPAWVQLSQLDGTIDQVNAAACAISGYGRSELVGQTWPYP